MQVQDTTISPVKYRDIPGFPGYRVGSDGTVWSCRMNNGKEGPNWRKLKFSKSSGYFRIGLCQFTRNRYFCVHYLILLSFVGPRPDGMVCCHCNGDRTDNRLENRRWDTRESNSDDMRKHGTHLQGSNCGMAKLVESEVVEIRRLYQLGGWTYRQLGAKFGVGKTMVGLIIDRKFWKHVA